MHRRLLIAVVLAALVLIGGSITLAVRRSVAGPVYPVAEVQAGLRSHPADWLGRTVLVQSAIPFNSDLDVGALGGISCTTATAQLLLPATGRGTVQAVVQSEGPLPLIVPGCADPVLAPLRRIPLLSGFLPRAQVLRFGVGTTYRVRIEHAPVSFPICPTLPCYRAVLLDPSPVQPLGFIDPSIFIDPSRPDHTH